MTGRIGKVLFGGIIKMKLLVIDGNSILNRAFYGIKLLSTKDGRFTNGIYGFLTIFLRLKEEYEPDAVAVAFDVKGPTFRHEMYDGYKAQRKGMPPELAEQLPVLKELLAALGIKTVESPGWEADDILGTLAGACGEDDRCIIATGDKDSLQLIGPNVSVVLSYTGMGRPQSVPYSVEKVKEEFGVTPEQLIEVKALMGDSSDNIPGVAGVGKKTATDLIQRFGSVENLYNQLETADIKPAVKDKLEKGKDMAFLSRQLGIISSEVPIDTSPESYLLAEPDVFAVTKIMADLEMFKLLERLNLKAPDSPPRSVERAIEKPLKFTRCEDPLGLLELLKKHKKAYFKALYTDELVTEMYFALPEEVVHITGLDIGYADFEKAFFEEESIEKYTDDLKKLLGYCERCGYMVKGIKGDVTLSGYVLNPNASDYGVGRLLQEYNVKAPLADTEDAAAVETAALPRLFEVLEEKIKENNQLELLNNIEIPLAGVLAKMETVGFAVDKDGLRNFGSTIEGRINELDEQVQQSVGYPFNLNSPKQLGEALFDKLGLKAGRKTKSGYSTGADVLESLKGEHPVIEMILEYRALAKLKSTYCDGLVKVVGDDGRIHSTLNQTETRTGRLSSTDPNLQNIPIRTELGRELRRFFLAKEDWVLVDADYSQIELRILAHISGDEAMIEAFKNKTDIHTVTASQVFNMPEEFVTPLMRNRAKAVNFGIVYGIGPFSLAKDIGVTRAEADSYIKGYLAHYKGVAAYMKRVVETARENGYVETLFKRRRYLPELSSSNGGLRAFGERVALNMPIQGSAADIIKIAMIKVTKRLKEENLDARLIMQVHDELIVESPKQQADTVARILNEEMENAAELLVPLVADVNIGKTWFDAKG